MRPRRPRGRGARHVAPAAHRGSDRGRGRDARGRREGLTQGGAETATSRHRFVEHVGEVELALDAASEAGLYREALAAFRELVDAADGGGDAASHVVELPPGPPAALLRAWLDELVFLAEVEDFVPERAPVVELGRGGLRATVRGVRGRPRHLVKGVTLHDLSAGTEGGMWHARVVLDV